MISNCQHDRLRHLVRLMWFKGPCFEIYTSILLISRQCADLVFKNKQVGR